jgi:hypothetical protein
VGGGINSSTRGLEEESSESPVVLTDAAHGMTTALLPVLDMVASRYSLNDKVPVPPAARS